MAGIIRANGPGQMLRTQVAQCIVGQEQITQSRLTTNRDGTDGSIRLAETTCLTTKTDQALVHQTLANQTLDARTLSYRTLFDYHWHRPADRNIRSTPKVTQIFLHLIDEIS